MGYLAYFRAYMTAEVAHGGYNKNSMAICSINGTLLQHWYLVSVKIRSAVPTMFWKKAPADLQKMRSSLWLSVPSVNTKLAEIHGNLSGTQEALREAGGGSFKNERPIAYRAKKSAYRMWASPLCFAASISWHLIFIPVTSPPRSDYFSFPHLVAASLWNSSHRIPLPVHLASAHLISAHAIHLISCLL